MSEGKKESETSLKYREALLGETREELQKADSKASILLATTGIAKIKAAAKHFAAIGISGYAVVIPGKWNR
jgi:hypothetical protein